MSVHAAAVLAALLVVLAGPTIGGSPLESHTSGAYGIVADGSVHTPVETVRLGAASVDVVSTSSHNGYEPLTVAVTAPAGEPVRVELFDVNGDRRTVVTPDSDGTVSVPTDALSSGTYYLVVRGEGEIRAVERVVVSRHDVTFSAIRPASADDDDLAFRIGIIPGGDIPYYEVEVVATDGTRDVVTPAPEVRLGLHEATVDRAALPPGEYAVYARLVGRPDPAVGMSDPIVITIDGTAGETGQSGETDVATEVATERPATVTETDSSTTATEFPETSVALLFVVLLVAGVTYRLRRRGQ